MLLSFNSFLLVRNIFFIMHRTTNLLFQYESIFFKERTLRLFFFFPGTIVSLDTSNHRLSALLASSMLGWKRSLETLVSLQTGIKISYLYDKGMGLLTNSIALDYDFGHYKHSFAGCLSLPSVVRRISSSRPSADIAALNGCRCSRFHSALRSHRRISYRPSIVCNKWLLAVLLTAATNKTRTFPKLSSHANFLPLWTLLASIGGLTFTTQLVSLKSLETTGILIFLYKNSGFIFWFQFKGENNSGCISLLSKSYAFGRYYFHYGILRLVNQLGIFWEALEMVQFIVKHFTVWVWVPLPICRAFIDTQKRHHKIPQTRCT
jgi:hypothetical protein